MGLRTPRGRSAFKKPVFMGSLHLDGAITGRDSLDAAWLGLGALETGRISEGGFGRYGIWLEHRTDVGDSSEPDAVSRWGKECDGSDIPCLFFVGPAKCT